MSLAVLATMVPAASATTPIEVRKEPNLTHCGGVAGECDLHMSGESLFRTHFFGIEANEWVCGFEIVAALDEQGGGSVTSALFNQQIHTQNCGVDFACALPCDRAELLRNGPRPRQGEPATEHDDIHIQHL